MPNDSCASPSFVLFGDSNTGDSCLSRVDENLSSRIVTLAEWHRFDIGCARLDGMVVLDRDVGALLRWSSFGEISRPKLDEDADVLRPSGSPVCICT